MTVTSPPLYITYTYIHTHTGRQAGRQACRQVCRHTDIRIQTYMHASVHVHTYTHPNPCMHMCCGDKASVEEEWPSFLMRGSCLRQEFV